MGIRTVLSGRFAMPSLLFSVVLFALMPLHTRTLQFQYELANYNGNSINEYYRKHPLQVWERLVDIGSPIAGWYIQKKLDDAMAPFSSEDEKMDRIQRRAADLRASIIQTKSVACIKSGQALALRPDLIKSPDYIR
jgi:predicted unusual protein kinase regulating ubiquinone biosynthesis (AarF/ABC1/UbiB family)